MSPGRHRVLLVEDDAGIREGISELLAFEGYEVDRAANGAEALDRLRDGARRWNCVHDVAHPGCCMEV